MRNYFLYFICFSSILISCKSSSDPAIVEQPVPISIGTVNKDSTAPPTITTLGAPDVISAPKPRVVPLKYPYGVGQPSIVNNNVGDGLPQNLILNLAVDKKGNLWSGGLGFLSKFDGTHFTNFSKPNGLGNGFVFKILVDHNDQIWVGNFDGLYRFDGHSFQPTLLFDYDKSINLRGLCEDSKGAIWIASSKGVFKIVGDSMTKFGEKEGLSDPFSFNVCTDKNDRLLVSTRKGIFQLEGDQFIPYDHIPVLNGKVPGLIGKDRVGNVWFTRRHVQDENLDLIRFDGKESEVFSVKEGLDVSSGITNIMEDKNGILWFGTYDNGLIRFDGKQFVYLTSKDGLPSNTVYSIAEDNVGNIWVGTNDGLSMLSYSYLNNLEAISDGQAFNNIFTIGPDGTRWVLESKGESNLLIQYREKEALVYDLDALKIKSAFQSIRIDRKGQIWLTFFGANKSGNLIKFDEKAFYIYGEKQGIRIFQNLRILEDGQENLWLFGSGGVMKLNDQTLTHYSTAQGFPERVSTFFIDSKGHYWMNDNDSTVCRFDGKYITRYSRKNGFDVLNVNSINEDPFGNIWFASEQGAVRFDGRVFKTYSQMEGMDNLVAGIGVDTTRRLLWFSTIKGLLTLPFANIDSADPGFQTYSQRNGFGIIASHIQSNQTYFDSLGIWGSSYNGTYRFDYDKVRQFKEPLLGIRNIRLNNQEVLWTNISTGIELGTDSLSKLNEAVLKFGKPMDSKRIQQQQAAFGSVSFDSLQNGSLIPENLVLPYNNNSITFEFASISPSFGKYTQYRYKLEGYEDNWSPFSNKDEAFFGNMSEGTYTFRLEAISSTGAQTTLNYSFRVLPPWWRTWWAYAAYILLFVSGIYLFIRWRVKALQKDKLILEHKVNVRTNELKESLNNLKETQAQLVQSEKMASLGELTAGIAHEIQNPLNFVNNFSEVNRELISEMVEEVDKGNTDEVKAIAKDIKDNEEKISYHGKRADAIVKGMLQHSRSSSSQKEPTDINALCDEYLRLSYHGLRAKDSNFNAKFETIFDTKIENINVVPQDIGRVLLNLINNAFYAVDEKKKQIGEGYEPTVSIGTKKINGNVEISVTDNGNGIPQKVLDKIFQPFFTTKPTGQGTGLGLSLSYDIIKAHGGELKVETKEGEGSTFIIVMK